MAQAWLHLWQRPKTAAVDCTATTQTETQRGACSNAAAGARTSCCCGCLAKLIRKLRKQGRILRAAATGPSRQQSFQCRYDPLSYSLNFDRSLLDDDEEYFQFCAFSSRFVANPTRSSVSTAT